MTAYSVAEAKANLSRLIDLAMAGEEVVITRHGKPVVDILATPQATVHMAADSYEWLRARRAARPPVSTSAVDVLNQMFERE